MHLTVSDPINDVSTKHFSCPGLARALSEPPVARPVL